MGLWSLLTGGSRKRQFVRGERPEPRNVARQCRFETMEERRLLDADPIKIGAIYIEADSGSDLHGDTFQVLFEGGAPGTELTRLVIDGDQGSAGLSVGDMLFDTIKGGLGADEAFPLQVISSSGIEHVSWQVADGGSKLIFEFRGFNAGEKLVFSIDVDEVQDFDPSETNQQTINEGIDPIASGVEFQGSQLTGDFKAPHYHNISGTSEYRNLYDPLFVGTNLLISQGNANGLPHDDYEGKRDRSTGTLLNLQQLPLPVTIGGRVFADYNRNLLQDGSDVGLSSVSLALWKKVNGQWTSTGHTTLTNAQGDYKFGLDLNLQPGEYQVRESQPAEYLSVGAIPGTVSGTPTGSTVAGDPDVLTSINIPLGDQHGVNYNFAETQPISLRGHVYLSGATGDCDCDCNDENAQPLSGVKITLKDAQGNVVATQLTNASGEYVFADLLPGTYTIVEETPAGLLDGADHIGTVGGLQLGSQLANDTISSITLVGGQHGINYDFCEHEPADLSGHVYHDTNDNGVRDSGEAAIPGTTVILTDASGTQIVTTTTDSTGFYKFANLSAGNYIIREVQPTGFLDGKDAAGTINGQTVGSAENPGDRITGVVLAWGDSGVNYDFGEIQAVSIAGHVFADTDGDCTLDPGEAGIAGVTIYLLDANGNVVSTTQTNAQGEYLFASLRPGTYSVREQQPGDYFDGGETAGSHGGDDSQNDLVANVVLHSGDNATDYDFCEKPAATLSGYVFRDGPPIITPTGVAPENIHELRDGLLTADDLRLRGVTLELRDTLTGEPIRGEDLLPGMYPSGPVRVVTDANGYYEFRGLPRGNYSIFEVHPEGYIDSLDTPGTTSGLAVNPGEEVSPFLIQRFSAQGVSFKNDAILQVPLNYGQHSQLNNFSEVQVQPVFIPPPEERLPPPPPPEVFLLPFPLLAPPPDIFIPPAAPPLITGGGSAFTWHLSVIDAGLPRVARRSTRHNPLVFSPALWIEKTEWQSDRLRDGTWTIHGSEQPAPHAMFGLAGAIPVVGDFNGDGKDDIGIFYKGEWFLDLNGNGQWDAEDLWAKLGADQDKPVTGDWDGDGKTDIGIYGPEWPGDPVQLEHEPGLPDQDNRLAKLGKPKNVPPVPEEATDGERLLRLTSQGKERADLIDHVFRFGGNNHIPIAGDWNGDGIRSIGVFKDGKWHFDMDGDGRWSQADKHTVFGQQGDLPVVGDFDGDGIEEIAVFRSGRFIIDANGNRQLDPADRTVELGQAGDLPIAGDFNGDGIDEPAIYRAAE